MSGLHVRQFGEQDAPAIVCLHGVTSWGGHFEALAALLAPAYRVARARPARPRRLGAGAPVADRRPPRAPLGSPGRRRADLAGALVRRPARVRVGRFAAGSGRSARAPRPGNPRPTTRRPLGRRARTHRAPVPELRGGDRSSLRGEPAPSRAADARPGRASAPPRRGARRLALPLLAGGRGRGVRRDGLEPATVRESPHPDPPRARRAARTCRTTTCSTPTERRSATCSRSSPCPVATRCSGMRSTRPPPRSSRFLARPGHTAVDSRP